jgi:hypothetical protein
MSVRSHRIIKIIHDGESINFHCGDEIFQAIKGQPSANDQTNMDGGGIIEIPFNELKEILKNKKDYGFSAEQVQDLKDEIENLTRKGIEDDAYVIYDMF